jgi:PAS domain S-box-containing protein
MRNNSWASETTTLLRSVIPSLIIPAIILIALYFISLQNYLLFHGIVELAGIAVALCIFIIVWNTRKIITNTFFLILGLSFLFTGSFDLVHALAYKGMGVFAGASSDLPTQLWIAARYFQSVTFLIATLFIGKSITKNRRYDTGIIVITFTLACSILYASIFVWQNFPHCFIDGSGLTPFKIISEYIISAILVASIIAIYVKRKVFDYEVWQLLLAALVFLILGELAFTSYISVYGFMNMLGHLFRLISVYLFYRAFVVVSLTRPYNLLFRELKENEKALREANGYLNNLFDYANAPIIVWNPEYVITRFNHAFENLTLRSGQEVIGQRLDILFPEESKERSLLQIKKTLEGERWEIVEIPILIKDGSVRTVLWNSANILDPDGRILSTIAQGVDITNRKRAEEALSQANKKLNLLSSITRHDINNQLTVQIGYIELLEDTQIDPSQNEYFQKVSTAAKRIAAMIQFTKEYENIGVNAPVWQNCRTLVDTAATEAPLGKVMVKNELPIDTEVFADPLVGKVFYNLMDNAVRYGGKITTIRFSALKSGDDHLIVCEDDGDGIPAEEKEKIFERGFGKNTGLGLALSREILSITGITIRETGEPGKGARFVMTVPKGMWRIALNGD